jgi:hypothetical protein
MTQMGPGFFLLFRPGNVDSPSEGEGHRFEEPERERVTEDAFVETMVALMEAGP